MNKGGVQMLTKTEAAKKLNISRTTLYKELEKCGIKGKKITDEEFLIVQKSVKGVQSVNEQINTKNVNDIKRNSERNEQISRQKEQYEQMLIDKDNKYNEMLLDQKSIVERKNKDIESLEVKIKELEARILFLEKDNRQILQDLHNANILASKVTQQNVELIDKTQALLLAPKEENQETEIIQEPVHEEAEGEKTSPRQKKWWRR